jgi:hypothetical protein
MKLTNMAALFALIVMICSAPIVAQRTTRPSAAVRSPEVVLREFYKWYIHAGSHDIDPLKTDKATFRKYVSARFIREIERNERLPEGEGFDADYFLQTQDPLPSSDANNEAEWLKSISVSRVAVKGTTATAIVTFFAGYPKVKVSLIQEGGVWKINHVADAH